MSNINENLFLICGKSTAGKSMSLRGIKNQEGVVYLNCESGKKLPFKNKFKRKTITDPYDVFDIFEAVEEMDDVHTIVIDSLTYLMEMFENLYVVPKAGTKEGMTAWSDYAQFFKTLMMQHVAASTKNVIMTAHVADQLNESEGVMETMIKVKGALMNNGVESWFSNIVMTKRIPIKKLKKMGFENDMLNITEEEEFEGVKHVFQVKHTADTANERIRASYGMWDRHETIIDNNLQYIIDRNREYYDEEDSF